MSDTPRDASGIVGIIPALNAAATIAPVIQGAFRHLQRVLVIDDGSSDDTATRAAAAGAEVIRHPANRGKGAALVTAFSLLLEERRDAGGTAGPRRGFEAALTLDADGQHDADDIPRLLDLYLRECPSIIVGSRDGLFAQMWAPRRAMNRFSSFALRLFTGADLPDSQSGFRLYDARFLESVMRDPAAPLGPRYEAEMELLMRAAARRLRIVTLPIRLHVTDGRETSHYRPLVDTLRISAAVLRHALARALGRRRA